MTSHPFHKKLNIINAQDYFSIFKYKNNEIYKHRIIFFAECVFLDCLDTTDLDFPSDEAWYEYNVANYFLSGLITEKDFGEVWADIRGFALKLDGDPEDREIVMCDSSFMYLGYPEEDFEFQGYWHKDDIEPMYGKNVKLLSLWYEENKL